MLSLVRFNQSRTADLCTLCKIVGIGFWTELHGFEPRRGFMILVYVVVRKLGMRCLMQLYYKFST